MKTRFIAASAAILVLSACSRDSTVETAAVDEQPTVAAPQPQVANLQLASEPAADGTMANTTATGFSPGQPINVSMQVSGVTPDTPVTVQWYGPNDQPLGHETKNVTAGQEQLTFTHDNTHDWAGGGYRAEVWVNGRKLEEESFQIAAGGLTAAADES